MYHKISIQKIFKTFLLKIVVLWTSKNCSQDKILDFFKTLKDNLEDFLVVNGKKDISCLSNKAQAVFSFLAGIGCGAVVIDFLVFIEDR